MEIKAFFIKLGKFFRILDEYNNNLSLTNVAVIIVLVKLCMAPAVSITDIGALLISLLSYTGKKVLNNKKPTELELPEAIASKLKSMEDTITNLKSKIGGMDLAKTLRPPY